MRTPSLGEEVSEESSGLCSEHGHRVAVCQSWVAVSLQYRRKRPTVYGTLTSGRPYANFKIPMVDSTDVSEFDLCPIDPAGEVCITRPPGSDL